VAPLALAALEEVGMTDNTLFYAKNRDVSSEKTNK
jgi:hypothetical protein